MRSVNIVAMARWCPPPQKMTGDIWSINNSHAVWRGRGRHYTPDLIIALDDLRRDEKTHPDYVEAIVTAGCPVYNTFRSRKWKTVEEYPLKRVFGKFPNIFLYDNSVNYAFMLAMTEGYERITFWGTDFVYPYDQRLLRSAAVRWERRGYRDAPDWFRYYDFMNVEWRASGEPGWESFHYLLGYAEANKIDVRVHPKSTILNQDRKPFFYGYDKQPKL